MKLLKLLAGASLVAAGLVVALASPAGAAGVTGAVTVGDAVAPAATAQCSLASFDAADVSKDPKTGGLLLTVKGTKPASNVSIELVPLTYIQQPVYWAIMVVGCSSGAGLPVVLPYTATLDVTHTVGTEGIAVEGSNQTVLIPV